MYMWSNLQVLSRIGESKFETSRGTYCGRKVSWWTSSKKAQGDSQHQAQAERLSELGPIPSGVSFLLCPSCVAKAQRADAWCGADVDSALISSLLFQSEKYRASAVLTAQIQEWTKRFGQGLEAISSVHAVTSQGVGGGAGNPREFVPPSGRPSLGALWRIMSVASQLFGRWPAKHLGWPEGSDSGQRENASRCH